MSSTMGTDFRRIASFLVMSAGCLAISSCNVAPNLSMSGQPCDPTPCPQRGVYLDTIVNASRAELSTLELEIVKNGAHVRVTPTPLEGGTGFGCDVIGPLTATCRLTPIEPGTTSRLELHITGLDVDFVDGDDYAITVSSPSAPQLLLVEETVRSYQMPRPGSEHCELQCRFYVLST